MRVGYKDGILQKTIYTTKIQTIYVPNHIKKKKSNSSHCLPPPKTKALMKLSFKRPTGVSTPSKTL